MRQMWGRGLLFAVVALSGVVATAQGTPAARMPPTYPGVMTRIPGIFVTPVPGAPFLADVEIVSHNRTPDGTDHVTTTVNHIARTSSGRIYNERRQMVPPGFTGTPRLLSSHTYDPSSRLSVMMEPFTHLAREVVLRGPETTPQESLPPSKRKAMPGTTETDLGTQTIESMQVHGFRKTRTVPAEASGTGKPVVITDDYWYSEALSIYMVIRHDDPRTGEQLVAVTNVEREEPPAEKFVIPADYKVVDETTPQAPRAAQ